MLAVAFPANTVDSMNSTCPLSGGIKGQNNLALAIELLTFSIDMKTSLMVKIFKRGALHAFFKTVAGTISDDRGDVQQGHKSGPATIVSFLRHRDHGNNLF